MRYSFRTWDYQNKKMLQGIHWDLYCIEEVWRVDPQGLLNSTHDGKKLFTMGNGLKDKAGKEIYEGDIVSNNGLYFLIVYENASFRCYDLKEKRMSSVHAETLAKQYEIIGNVFETPELLEKST